MQPSFALQLKLPEVTRRPRGIVNNTFILSTTLSSPQTWEQRWFCSHSPSKDFPVVRREHEREHTEAVVALRTHRQRFVRLVVAVDIAQMH